MSFGDDTLDPANEQERNLRTQEQKIRQLKDAVRHALNAYDYRVQAGLSPMGKIHSMEQLRFALKETET